MWKVNTQMIFTDEGMPMYAYLSWWGILISQVWRDQNTEINVYLFKNASDDMKQKQVQKISIDTYMKKD